MSSASWHVIVLSWNGREDTLACLASLRDLQAPKPAAVCVDNGSTDGSADAVRTAFPDVTVIENPVNLGFSGGNNVGIAHALEHGAEWVVLVNNDATLAPDAIANLQRASARHPRAGVLAGKILDPDGSIQWAGQRVGLLTGYSGRPRGHGKQDGPAFTEEGPTERALGAFMAVSRRAIEVAGVLDESLFAYVEDVDWSLRIREAGFEVIFVPDARAWHRVSASTGGGASTHTIYYGARNTVAVVERHRPLGRIGTTARRLAIAASFGLHALTKPHPLAALTALRDGLADARAGRYGPRR